MAGRSICLNGARKFHLDGFGPVGPLVRLALVVCTAALSAAEPRAVSFPAQDGVRIFADYYAPGYSREPLPMVVLLHDAGQERGCWKSLAEALAEGGFAVLAPDLRGHGESASSRTRAKAGQADVEWNGELQSDLRGAYDWLAQQPRVDRARLVLIGVGVGACAALEYAVLDRSVDLIVALTPAREEQGFRSSGDLRQLSGRKLHLLGCPRDAARLEALRGVQPSAELRILECEEDPLRIITQAPGLCEELIRVIRAGVGEPSHDVVYGTLNSTIYHQPGSEWAAAIAPSNLRHYSSPKEAEARGLRAARSRGPGDRPKRSGRSR